MLHRCIAATGVSQFSRRSIHTVFSMLGAMVFFLAVAAISTIMIPGDILWSNDMSRTIRISEENWKRLEQLVGQVGTTDDKAGQALEPAGTPPAHHIPEADATPPGNHHPQAEGEAPQRWASTTGPPPVGGVFSPPPRGASTAAGPCGNFFVLYI